MKKKIFLMLVICAGLFSGSTSDLLAECIPVPSNQTTCSGAQPITCSQSVPPAGNIRRFCCSSTVDCNEQKKQVQDEIPSSSAGDIPLGTPKQDPTCEGSGIKTAIGCINFQSPALFTGSILRWLVGIGGGIAFLLILSATFTIMTSGGNPDRLKAGQEILTSAISGLILLIFSIFVLKLIGIDILGLDKFGFGTTGSNGGGSGGLLQIIR